MSVPDSWWTRGVQALQRVLWRGVEAQHRVATMKLVDTLDEQAEMERLLEASKPPLPRGTASLHYLIVTPFRYKSRHPSRFRKPGEPGIWYGAEDLPTACAEVAYWRWRFLMDSTGLRDGQLVTEHTFFQARAEGRALDLSEPPWDAKRKAWTHSEDYAACQALAVQARERGVQWIRYWSARRPPGHCGAVLDATCLALHEPTHRPTWVCKVTAQSALMVHDEERLELAFAAA
jgi:hypothetical protein